MAQYQKGEEDVARRKITREEEAALADEAAGLRDDEAAWDFARARAVRRGASPSAVLSVRVPLEQLKGLRRLAAVEGVSLSELLKEAVASYVGSTGPEVSSSRPDVLQLNLRRSSRSETMHPHARELHKTVAVPPSSFTETPMAS